LEVSGINRLLAIAQELGVREAKSVARPTGATREAVDHVRGRPAKSPDDAGLKISLSAEASSLAEGIATAPGPSHTSTPNPLDSSRTESRIGVETSGFRRNRAVAAYQKKCQCEPGRPNPSDRLSTAPQFHRAADRIFYAI